MRKTFTQSMAFLHTWCGLVFGWLLFVVLLTGTITVFRGEISYWLTPEIRGGLQVDPVRSLQVGEDYLRAHGPDSRLWRITLPTTREPVLKVNWRDDKGVTQNRRLDPETGQEIVRQTEGGDFYLELHEGFHIDRGENLFGFIVVCLTGMAMLISCVSGIVVHKRILKDMFLFRPEASAHRSWLDAHNLLGVLALPFHMMMAFTGIFLLYWLFLPSAAPVLYKGGNPEFRIEANGQLYRQLKDIEPGAAAPTGPLSLYVDKAEALIGKGRTAYVYVRDPGRDNAVIEVYRERTERVSQQVDQIALDRSGGIIRAQLISRMSIPFQVQSFIASWHWLEWGGNLVRWFYYLAGWMGAGLVAAGCSVFAAKRRRHSEGKAWFQAVEAINVMAIAGVCIACVAYLWIERLTPVGVPGRETIGIQVFCVILGASLVHAALRGSRRAWVEQMALTAILCVGAPLLNGQILRHLASADWVRMSVDAALIATGVCFGAAAWRLRAPEAARLKPVEA